MGNGLISLAAFRYADMAQSNTGTAAPVSVLGRAANNQALAELVFMVLLVFIICRGGVAPSVSFRVFLDNNKGQHQWPCRTRCA